jgi:hypothetical protein
VNAYSESEVNQFNLMISDFNNRCAQYRYYAADLQAARSSIERHRAEIEAEGRSRFTHSAAPLDFSSGGTPIEEPPALPNPYGGSNENQ